MEFKRNEILAVYKHLGLEKIKGNGGSHRGYADPVTGAKLTELEHGKGTIAEGTGKSMLDHAIWLAFLMEDSSLAEKDCDFSINVKEYIARHYKQIQKNPMALVPVEVRRQYNINPLANDPEKVINDLKERILKNRQLATENGTSKKTSNSKERNRQEIYK